MSDAVPAAPAFSAADWGRRVRRDWQAWAALLAVVVSMLAPLAGEREGAVSLADAPAGWIVLLGAAAVVAAARRGTGAIVALALGAHLGAAYALALLPAVAGRAGVGYWALVIGAWLLAWLLVARLAELRPRHALGRVALRIAAPLIFGIWLLILWEIMVRALGVLPVILPAPSAIWARIVSAVPVLLADFRQTFLKAVLAGYAIGCAAGFVVAIIADRIPFLRRGVLPIGNFVSALPIIGVAPILVMWFGFDWQSKAAVVVVMTFFPMLVNTVAGLAAAGSMERDLMRSYAAGYTTSLIKLRLPAALPFIFNALKINSTLALIGAIVAEFFGTPIVGMGFRISAAIGRMDIDLVWAEIAVAALAGTVFYGIIALIERAVTFWHPSFRS